MPVAGVLALGWNHLSARRVDAPASPLDDPLDTPAAQAGGLVGVVDWLRHSYWSDPGKQVTEVGGPVGMGSGSPVMGGVVVGVGSVQIGSGGEPGPQGSGSTVGIGIGGWLVGGAGCAAAAGATGVPESGANAAEARVPPNRTTRLTANATSARLRVTRRSRPCQRGRRELAAGGASMSRRFADTDPRCAVGVVSCSEPTVGPTDVRRGADLTGLFGGRIGQAPTMPLSTVTTSGARAAKA